MAKKGAGNFTKQVTKELIKEQKQKKKELEKQQKEEYINNRYEEAKTLTNNIYLINGSLLVDYFNQYGINSYILNKR